MTPLRLLCCFPLLIACSAEPLVETRLSVPHVPADLRAPCLVDPGDYTTLKAAARLVTDLVEGLDCANGRIAAMDGILTAAEAKAGTK